MPRKTKLEVTSPSGATVRVQDLSERKFYESKMKEYGKYKMTHQADMDLLDQLLLLLLQNHRLTNELTLTYKDLVVAEHRAYNDMIKKNSEEIRYVMDKLGISASKRSEREEKSSVAGFIKELQEKAVVFKMEKDKQKEYALRFMAELSTIMRLREACDQEELDRLGYDNDEKIYTRILGMLAEYGKLDKDFRDKQRKWNFMKVE